jgi:hypothetical protein
MRSVRPSHEFGDLWAFLGVTMKVLEVPKRPWIQGFRSDGPGEVSNTIYWPETLFFGGTTHSCEFASPWLSSPWGRAPLHYQVDPRKKKVKGPPVPTGRRPLGPSPGCRHRGLWASPPPWPWVPWLPPLPLGKAHLHHHLQHILIIPTVTSSQTWCVVQNYYFPMTYCIYVYVE